MMNAGERERAGLNIAGVYPERPITEGSHWKSHYGRNPQSSNGKLGTANPNERVKGLGPGGGAQKARQANLGASDFPSLDGGGAKKGNAGQGRKKQAKLNE